MLILAVDDETLMLNMLVETLKNVFSDERYVVMGFDDGKQALEYVSSSEESLPYAFLDIRLRGMLGSENAETGRDGGCAGSRQKQNFDQCQKDQVRLVRLSGWRQFSHQRLPG